MQWHLFVVTAIAGFWNACIAYTPPWERGKGLLFENFGIWGGFRSWLFLFWTMAVVIFHRKAGFVWFGLWDIVIISALNVAALLAGIAAVMAFARIGLFMGRVGAWIRSHAEYAWGLVTLLMLWAAYAVLGEPVIVFGPSICLAVFTYRMVRIGKNDDFAGNGFNWLLYLLIGASAIWAVLWAVGSTGIKAAMGGGTPLGVVVVIAVASVGLSILSIAIAGLVMKWRHSDRVG